MQKDKDGKYYKPLQFANKILECLGDQKKFAKQISYETGFEYQAVCRCLYDLVRAGQITETVVERFKYYRKTESACLLQDLLYPKDKVLKKFKVNGVRKYKMEELRTKFDATQKKDHGVSSSSMKLWETE